MNPYFKAGIPQAPWKPVRMFVKTLEIELPSTHLFQVTDHSDSNASVFTAAIFATVQLWNQSRDSSQRNVQVKPDT